MSGNTFRDYDIYGRKKSKKQKKGEQLADNVAKDEAAEDLVTISYAYMHAFEGEWR